MQYYVSKYIIFSDIHLINNSIAIYSFIVSENLNI